MRNEAENIAPLVAEIAAALAGRAFEVIYVNDGSTDGTEAELKRLKAQHPWLRQIRHAQSCGQSAALRTGMGGAGADRRHARRRRPERSGVSAQADRGAGAGRAAHRPGRGTARRPQGHRLQAIPVALRQCRARRDPARRHPRHRLRAEGFPRDVGLALPYFDGLHRFLPALIRREGRDIGYVDVVDRPRRHGVSNYGFWDRLWIGILDLVGVWWLIRRKKRVPDISEV